MHTDSEDYSQEDFDYFNELMKAYDKKNPPVKPNPYVKPLTERIKQNNSMDTYDVCLAYGLDAMRAHAVKKLLVPGKRNGGKSAIQDIEEAVWTLQELLKEMK